MPDPLREPGAFIDSAHPAIVAFAREAAAGTSAEVERAVSVYRAVRDRIRYDPYLDFTDPSHYRASGVLAAGHGFCGGKAALLAACARAVGIAARVGYADVRNHMTSRRLRAVMQSDIFRWHSYTDLHVDGVWVKATPAFDAGLCERVGVAVLDFDGRSDSLFHAFDQSGRRHMEYLHDRGVFDDVPFDTIVQEFRAYYPGFFASTAMTGDFTAEAVADQTPSDTDQAAR